MENEKHPKIGLALSGGSALGISHIGVIKSLWENKIPVDCVSGTSSGSIAAVGMAFEIPLEEMIDLSKKLNWTTISEFGYSKMGLNSNKPIEKILNETIGELRIEDAKIPLSIVATDIDTGKEFIFQKGKVTDAIMASTCLPGFFIPFKFKGRKLVDGGLSEVLPLIPLKEMGAEIRIGIDLSYWGTYEKTRNVIDVITNSFRILVQPQRNMPLGKSDIIVRPHLEKFSSSDFEKVNELIEAGYCAMNKMMPEIKKQMGAEVPEPETFFEKGSRVFKQLFHF